MVFYLGIYQYSKVNLLEAGHEHVVNYETSVKTAQEALGSIRDILIDKKQLYFQGLYSQYNKKYRIASASINTLAQIPRYLVEGFLIIAICGLVMILTYFGYSVTTLLPTIGVILLGSYRLLQPLQQCFSSFSIFRAARPSIENINSIIWNGSLSTNIGFVSTINPHRQNYKSTATKAMPIIRFSDVSFSYRTSEDVWALVDVSLSINPGDKVAIVGLSGSGKSTCCDLILGLLQPTKGHIYVEGRDLNLSHNEPATWQRRIAYVPQDIYLLDGSFIANIAFGSNEDSIDYARVRMAAEKARILELILSTPGGFDTPVGERGVRLSGGQRQRIGIARALYKEASVLVFDEATSSLDTLTESQISQSISDLDSSITTILIAHRMTTILRSNVIFLLSKGKLIASGTYDELRNNFPEFRKLTG
jgi:ATP-binding cassette subfamily B protein